MRAAADSATSQCRSCSSGSGPSSQAYSAQRACGPTFGAAVNSRQAGIAPSPRPAAIARLSEVLCACDNLRIFGTTVSVFYSRRF